MLRHCEYWLPDTMLMITGRCIESMEGTTVKYHWIFINPRTWVNISQETGRETIEG